VLIDEWWHRGDCEAARRTELIKITAVGFRNVLGQHVAKGSRTVMILSYYASLFMETFRALEPTFLCSDFWCDRELESEAGVRSSNASVLAKAS